MITKILTASTIGLEANLIQVEIDITPALPSMVVVGLPDKAVQESKERIRSGIKQSGYEFPQGKVTINLAPADTPKAGTGFDLPITIGILQILGYIQIPEKKPSPQTINLENTPKSESKNSSQKTADRFVSSSGIFFEKVEDELENNPEYTPEADSEVIFGRKAEEVLDIVSALKLESTELLQNQTNNLGSEAQQQKKLESHSEPGFGLDNFEIKKVGNGQNTSQGINQDTLQNLSEKIPNNTKPDLGFLDETLFLGELSLDGMLRPIKGVLSIAIWAKKKGYKNLVIPLDNLREASLVIGLNIYGAQSLSQVVDFLNSGCKESIIPKAQGFDFGDLDQSQSFWQIKKTRQSLWVGLTGSS